MEKVLLLVQANKEQLNDIKKFTIFTKQQLLKGYFLVRTHCDSRLWRNSEAENKADRIGGGKHLRCAVCSLPVSSKSRL